MSGFIVVHSVKVATDFVPETFGRLTTIGPKFLLREGKKGNHASRQVCLCSCGNTTVVQCCSLNSRNTQSCGCLHRDSITIHGKKKTHAYSIWNTMKRRCENPNNHKYPDYGGRGIRVCDRWLAPNGQGVLNFIEDMGERPSVKHTIERKDVNGNYEPNNCEWATYIEQARNKRNNKLLTHNGKTQCTAAWAEELKLSVSTLNTRLFRGWSIKDALDTPCQTRYRNKRAI